MQPFITRAWRNCDERGLKRVEFVKLTSEGSMLACESSEKLCF